MIKILISISVFFLCQTSLNAQILKKLKEKAENAAGKVIDKKTEEKIDPESKTDSSTPGRNRISNTEGAGLITTPPDVKENLNSVEAAFNSGNFGAARYAIQQAILGVEMEIGFKLLKSLPETIAGLPRQSDQDEVTSSGWGWTGLNIHRAYQNENKQFELTIANNSMLSMINQFLIGGAYGQSTGGQQKWKQIIVKGNKAIIEYDAGSGYKVSIPLGQSSLLAFEGVNFATEQDMMTAVNEFNIDKIKNTLGEK
jgi:hypothetical protein